MNSRVIDIRREQQFQKVRRAAGPASPQQRAALTRRSSALPRLYLNGQEQEELFRDTSEALNSRVVWFVILQIVVLVVTSAVQLRYLTVFFHSKKVA